MNAHRFLILDVFTDRAFAGNQLAVLPEARGLDTESMQKFAREFNFSETIFVLPPENPAFTRRVRIFTPMRELPFAGHPTVGCAAALASIGAVKLDSNGRARIVLEEGVGPIPVTISAGRDRTWPLFAQFTTAKLPEEGPPAPSSTDIAAAISLKEENVLTGAFGPQGVSCGFPFLFVPLRDMDCVRRARINLVEWERVLKPYWAPEVFVFTMTGERDGSDVHARMFAPGHDIVEDPATGSACAGLAGYLAWRDAKTDGTCKWRVEQGFEMGRPSIIDIEADKREGRVSAVRVGGHAVVVAEGTINVD
jgi:trans-2,3-dihydro-3-hydroxyanthranilate isomerase